MWTDRDGNPICIYGVPAYPLRECLICPFKNPNAEEEEFNKAMSSVREVVEWGFGKLIQQFAFLDYRKNL